jgi:hypothetical protein
MAWYDSILKPLANQLAILMKSERTEYLQTGKAYYDGNQPKPLKVLPGKPDDNVLLNFTGLVVERSVSMLFGGGVKFDYDEEESTEAETLRKIWDVNKMDLLMHETGTDGAIYGTFYIRTDPLAITDPYTGEQYTELVLLDPELMEIEVSPRNMREVTKYIMQYKIDDTLYREEYYPKSNPDEGKGWVVDYYVAKGVWRLVKTIDWDYDFPPILHSKNLPSVHSVYGTSDIDDILGAQDTINFVASNIRKVIRNQAHKRLWGKGFNAESLEMGSDDMPILPNADAAINAIDATADMTSSEANFNTMRQSLFDIARVVDISSVSDKIGSLTNFGLRVLYSDALSKNATKRLLYGEALRELNRRLLVLEGYAGEKTRPPQVVWGADLPQDEAEDAKLIHDDLNMGLVSKQTASKARGYQWDTDDHDEGEKDLIAAEGETSGRNTDVAMANFLRRGR